MSALRKKGRIGEKKSRATGSTRIRTEVTGIKAQCDNHYTIPPRETQLVMRERWYSDVAFTTLVRIESV